MTVVVDRALCLRRHPFSESSLIVHAITARHGRVHLLARGAYRPTSRYFAVLDLFDELELEWDAAPKRELQILRSGSILVRRRAVRQSLEHYEAAVFVLELADIAARHSAIDPELFERVSATLSALEEPGARADWVLARFELAFLDHLGLTPALAACASCGRDAPPIVHTPHERAAFSAGAGGRLCESCAAEARSAGRRVGTLPVQVLDDGRALARGDAKLSGALEPMRVERVRDFLGRFLDYHLETRPKSQRAFLAVPNRNAVKSTPGDPDQP